MAGEFVGAQDRSHSQRHRQDAFLRRHKDIRGIVRPDLWRNGVEHVRKMKVTTALRFGGPPGVPAPAVFAGVQWSQIDPRLSSIPTRLTRTSNSGNSKGQVPLRERSLISQSTRKERKIRLSTSPQTMEEFGSRPMEVPPGIRRLMECRRSRWVRSRSIPRILRLSMPEPATSLTVEECSRKAWASIHLPTPERPGPFGGAVLTNKAVTDIALPASNVLLVATNAGLFRSVDGGENFGNNAPQFNNSSPVLNGSISSLNWIWHRQPPFMPECAARDYSSRRMRVQLFPPTCLPTLEDPPALSTTSRSASLLGQIPTCSPVSRIQPSLRLIKVSSSRQTAALLGQ